MKRFIIWNTFFNLIRSQRPQKLLMDQKHDTHLFIEVNQAIIWSFNNIKPFLVEYTSKESEA